MSAVHLTYSVNQQLPGPQHGWQQTGGLLQRWHSKDWRQHIYLSPLTTACWERSKQRITCLRNHHHYTQRTFLFSNLPQNIQYTVKSHKLPCDLKLLADILLVQGFLATKETEAAPVQVTSLLCAYLLQRTDHPQESTWSNLRHAKYITLSRWTHRKGLMC